MHHARLLTAVLLLVLVSARHEAILDAQGTVPPPADVVWAVDNATVTIGWTPSSAPGATYLLEAGSAPGLADVATFDSQSASTVFVTHGVAPGTYYVRVRARTPAGLSAPSADAAIIVAPPCAVPPAAPVNLTSEVSGTVVTLRWQPDAACASDAYILEAGSAPGQSDIGAFDTGVGLTSVNTPAAAATYYVRVRARNEHGISAPSAEAVVRVGASTTTGSVAPVPSPAPPTPSTKPRPAPAPSPKPAAAPAPTPSHPKGNTAASGGTLRVLTWNIHHGRTKSGKYDPAAQARFIANQNPHVVLLQEVQTWDEYQPARYKALLEQYTGVSWRVQWAPVNNRAATEGNVVLTRLPVVSSSATKLHATGDHDAMYSNRSVAHTTVKVGNVPVHVFSTHLDWYNRTHRTAQLLDMMAWTERFGARRIVGGDFNSWWGEYWITTMMSDYDDTWQDVTGSKENGYTVNNAVRFDYLFRGKSGGDDVKPQRVMAPATTLSDHNPVIADYLVTP